jgi:ATP-binding cassette subfamily F protein 3
MHEHESRLEKLQAERVDAPKATKKLRLPAGALAGGGPSRSGEIVIRVEGLVVGYLPGRGAVTADGTPATEAKRVATVPFLAATRGDRIGIVGPNGAGKTTLLRTIAGDLPPLDGALSFGNAVQPGYLAQLRDAAIPGETVLDALLEAIPVTPGEARGFLARFLFRGEDVFKEVAKLSGGERSRLELALLGIMPSNLLLLDEPTNHLDIPAREAIEAFMTDSPATLLVVSHDRRLLETVCTSLWVVDDGLAVPFAGGWKEWRAAVADGWTVQAAAEREAARLRGGAHGGSRVAATAIGAGSGTAVAPSNGRRSGSTAVADRPGSAEAAGPAPGGTRTAARSGRREKLSKDAYRRQRALVDADLTRLGLRKTQLELSMGSPAIAANFVEMRRVASELADVEQALAVAEDAWLELEERAP